MLVAHGDAQWVLHVFLAACRRILRCCCICCCRCCCAAPTPYPEEVLGTTRQLIIKLIIVLLALSVCACCSYGMSQIDTQLVRQGLSVINSIKVWLRSPNRKVPLLLGSSPRGGARHHTPARCSIDHHSACAERCASRQQGPQRHQQHQGIPLLPVNPLLGTPGSV